MKTILYCLLFCCVLTLKAQKDSQELFKAIAPSSYLLMEDELVNGKNNIETKLKPIDSTFSYSKDFRIPVHDRLFYEMGTLESGTQSFSILFIQSTSGNTGPKIEFMVLYQKDKHQTETAVINSFREHWMELCNAHQVGELVSELYQQDAFYYNRGRLINGTKQISQEYSYMRNPNYSLKLTPKKVQRVSNTIAYELGQCSGSYPLPYLLVWQQQENGNWQILLDSNF